MPTIEQLAYMAGFFDGEGCIHVHERVCHFMNRRTGLRVPYDAFRGSLKVSQNLRAPLELFHVCFGGNIHIARHSGAGRNWRHYIWECPEGRSVEFLQAMMPYLIVKKAEAEIAIHYFGSFKRGRRLTSEVRLARREMISQIRKVKLLGLTPFQAAI